MPDPAHVRAISLVLAFSVLAGGWFLLEYTNRQLPPSPSQPENRAESSLKALSPTQVAVVPTLMPQNMNITYKCQKATRISFSDKPCGIDEKTIAIKATEKEPPVPGASLAQLERQTAQAESDRPKREEKFAATATIPSVAVTTPKSNALQCKHVDDAVSVIDSRLRQPHDGPTGDYWTSERKRLMDERFALRC